MKGISIRNKTHFSCGLGVGTTKQYFEAAKEKNISHIALTDFCTLGGALEFYRESKDSDLKVAIGSEFNINYGGDLDTYPISLLCYNQEGYTNLCRLVTAANNNNRILNLQDIFDNNIGLYCISQDIRHKKALEPIFNDKLFFELIPYIDRRSSNLAILSEVSVFQTVVSSDSYMPNKEDKVLQDIMIQNSSFSKEDKTFPYPKYMMGLEELLQSFVQSGLLSEFKDYFISGLKNSEKIIEHCSNLELKFSDQIVNYPHILHPLNLDGVDKVTLLRRIIEKNKRWDLNNEEYKARLELEIDAITNNDRVNLIDYFLVLEDLCRYCRDNNVPVGPGRGSGAGSLVLYGLMVTHLDPIKYDLLFERFISKGRIEAGTLPDVDLDFANQDIVRDYLVGLYGEDRVKPIGTYQTLAIRGAIKDAFRTLYPEASFFDVNRITGAIDEELKEDGDKLVDVFLNQYEKNEYFIKLIEPYPLIKDAVAKLVGFNRQPGIHPCGLAITQDPIQEFMPVRITKGKQVLEYQADDCEYSGVIKYDILGLKTLKFFKSCLENIHERCKDSKFDYPKSIYDIPLDDRLTYDAFERGDTESVFQFNSNVAKSILEKIKITSLDDLSMVTSVGRPGPMNNGQHYDFIKRKNGSVPSEPPHPALRELLEPTLGVMIYQESVMKCAQLMGGYSLAETDNIRKAMGKKKIEILKPYKDGFVKFCEENFPDTAKRMPPKKDKDGKITEYDINKSEYIWNLMETFSGYGFNKSHSMAYTLIGYYCQYLKVHYPLEWWTACLENAGDTKHTRAYYSAFKNRIQLPSINYSTDKYVIKYLEHCEQDENGDDVDGMIIMPFGSVKNVGEKASQSIQENAPYSSFEDFFKRVNKRACNKRVVVNLIFAGAFDCFESDKEKLLAEFYKLRKDKKIPSEHQNITRDQEIAMRYEVMDFLVPNYIEMYPEAFSECKTLEQLKKANDKDHATIVGKVDNIKKRKLNSKNNAEYGVFEVLNDGEVLSVVCWPDEWETYKEDVQVGEVYKFFGNVNHYHKKTQINFRTCVPLKTCLGGIYGQP